MFFTIRDHSTLTNTTERISILLVDDEDTVRQTTQSMLEVAGFDVSAAVDGLDALEKYQAEADRFKVVLLDMSMPRLSGPETLSRLLELDPKVKVIISTGSCLDEEEIIHVLNHGAIAAIQKPYRLVDLVATVKSVLNNA